VGTLLSVKNLKTQFKTQDGIVKAVDDVSFDVQEGEILGLVGESGCGKSVSAMSLMRLVQDPPGKIVQGEILFEGVDLLKLSDTDMRKLRGSKIAMVFQEPMTSLNPVLTIERQMVEPLMLHMEMDREQARAKSLELLEVVGIPDAANRLFDYPHQFSGGMRQRVMIAMAMGCNPRLLIADEPTTALDVTIQAQVLEIMQNVTTQLGTALIIITHNLGVVARYAHRINVMYAGKIIETGTSEEIFKTPSHPYTIGLLKSVPRLDEPKKSKLDPIQGLPPDLINLPPGCAFRVRCQFAIDKCAQETPPLMRASTDNHLSACWVVDKLTAGAGATSPQ
jgi:oligopeptide/dipeptide ABC transporter ATP-binding protein